MRAQLPAAPEAYSLSSDSTLLQIWTEFFDPPTPEKQTTIIYQETDPAVRQAMSEPDLKDESLTFGQLLVGRGKAFGIASEAIRQAGINVEEEVPVLKEWTVIKDPGTGLFRTFLVESIPFITLEPLLKTLPASAQVTPPGQTGQLAVSQTNPKSEIRPSSPPSVAGLLRRTGVAALRRVENPKSKALPRSEFLASLPKAERHRPSERKLELAQAPTGHSQSSILHPRSPTVDIDYTTLATAANLIFAAGRTYYIDSTVTLSGTNTLDGGAMLKFATNGLSYDEETGWTVVPTQITISGSGARLNCLTGLGRPAILTARDDQNYGDRIYQSSDHPNGYYGNYYLYFSGVPSSLSNVRMLYAQTALGYTSASGGSNLLTHAQFLNCQNVICPVSSSDVLPRNLLVAYCSNFVSGTYATVRAEQITFSWLSNLCVYPSWSPLYLTNCLLCNVAHTNYAGGASIATPSPPPFQTAGNGTFYLADSTYRGAGTPNINPTLAADLKLRTTYPPIVLSNAITADTVLSPQAQREGAIPDFGYAYDPLDWILSGGVAVTNATLTLTNGVAVGIAGTAGLKLQDGSHLNSVGSPMNPNRLVRIESVQEWGGGTNAPAILLADDLVSSAAPKARLRFTELSVLANGGAQFAGGANMGVLDARDCRFQQGGIFWTNRSASTRALTLTNNLFERSTNAFGLGADAFTLHARNNLFKNSNSKLAPTNASGWTWYDNVFDASTNYQNANTFANDYNGYINCTELAGHGGNDRLTNTFVYQTGPLGLYYQPASTSTFINAGSRNADVAGLYHFCTTTNQIKEASSIVDLGLHYVAIDPSTGLPYDYDGDGFPDYLEDANGNGQVDTGESDWFHSPSNPGGGGGLLIFTPLE